MASLLLEQLTNKAAVDDAIRLTQDKVVVLRFGRAADVVCMQQDDVVRDLPTSDGGHPLGHTHPILICVHAARQVRARAVAHGAHLPRRGGAGVRVLPVLRHFADPRDRLLRQRQAHEGRLRVGHRIEKHEASDSATDSVAWFERTPDHTKFIGAFRTKQDLIDLVEARLLFTSVSW